MLADSSTQTYWSARPAQRTRSDVVRVFQYDPDLLAGVDAGTAELLRRRAVARRMDLPGGSWSPPSGDGDYARGLGLLILEGLVCRSICVRGRDCPELLGAGDLLRPWEPAGAGVDDGENTWRVLQPTTLAILDERLTALLSRWPSVMVAFVSRSTQRSRALAVQLAIAHTRQAETRLLALFWHLAERWGRMTPRGVVLPLPLTHELLGQLACLHRPTTSTALQRLVRAGEIARRPDRGWMLLGQPPVHESESAAESTLAA